MGNNTDTAVQSIEWREDHVRILDQTYLPNREVYSDIRDVGRIWEAIKKLRIRGAPAIGIAAAYGMYLGIKDLPENAFESFWVEVERVAEYLESCASHGHKPTMGYRTHQNDHRGPQRQRDC
ncbi:MAG: hypothetical protein U5J63_11410 [Fodinibius sp.]|nr:hypothetical protein [Fodinibius sp.]